MEKKEMEAGELELTDEELKTIWKALGETDMLWNTESKESKILSGIAYKIAKYLIAKA